MSIAFRILTAVLMKLLVSALVLLTLWAFVATSTTIQNGREFPSGIQIGSESSTNCTAQSSGLLTTTADGTALLLCVGGSWFTFPVGDISNLTQQISGLQSEIAELRAQLYGVPFSQLLNVEGGGWTNVYAKEFSGSETGPLASEMNSAYGQSSNTARTEYSTNPISQFASMGANQMLVWELMPQNSDTLRYLLFTLSPYQFNDMWNIASGDEPERPLTLFGLDVLSSSGTSSSYNLHLGSYQLSSGVAQLSLGSGSNTAVAMEWNFLETSANPSHYFHLWPSMDGTGAANANGITDRWGGVAIRNNPAVLDPFVARVENLAGGGWSVVYAEMFHGDEGGPTPAEMSGTLGDKTWMIDTFLDNPLATFTSMGASEMLIWQLRAYSNSIDWVHFTSISSSAFSTMWTRTTSSPTPTNGGSGYLSVVTSTGSSSSSVQLMGHPHGSGVVQYGAGWPYNTGVLFEFNFLTDSRDTNHFFYIWPSINGVYARSNGSLGRRYCGIALR